MGTTGRVGQEVVRLRFSPTDHELNAAETLLASAFEGSTLTEGGASVSALSSEQVPDRVLKIIRSVVATTGATVDSTRELYVGGTSQLASLWQDLAQVHTMLELLEQHNHVRQFRYRHY